MSKGRSFNDGFLKLIPLGLYRDPGRAVRTKINRAPLERGPAGRRGEELLSIALPLVVARIARIRRLVLRLHGAAFAAGAGRLLGRLIVAG